MGEFKRIFKYVWPQWPRLVTIVISVLVIAILFAASFMTIIPLLKVMMGQEGLHGWADRKICSWRYGVKFHVPEIPRLALTLSKVSTQCAPSTSISRIIVVEVTV